MTRIRERAITQSVTIASYDRTFGTSGRYGNDETTFEELVAFVRQHIQAQGAIRVEEQHEVTLLEKMTDTVIPDYKGRVKRGEILPTNLMTKSLTCVPGISGRKGSACSYFEWQKNPTFGGFNYRIVFGQLLLPTSFSFPSAYFSSSELNEMLIQANAKLYSEGIDILTSAVEARQTLSMLLGAKRSLLRIVSEIGAYLRGMPLKGNSKLRSIVDISDVISQAWLEGRFGWRILYYELLAIQDYLDNRREGKSLFVGRGKISNSSESTLYGATVNTQGSASAGFVGVLDPSVPGNSSLLNTAWEIIPFSVLVDMFFNIQDRILLMGGSPGNIELKPSSNFLVRKSFSTYDFTAKIPDPAPGWQTYVLDPPNSVIISGSTSNRSIPKAQPISWPSFDSDFRGLYQSFDAYALLRALFSKFKH